MRYAGSGRGPEGGGGLGPEGGGGREVETPGDGGSTPCDPVRDAEETVRVGPGAGGRAVLKSPAELGGCTRGDGCARGGGSTAMLRALLVIVGLLGSLMIIGGRAEDMLILRFAALLPGIPGRAWIGLGVVGGGGRAEDC